jgi:glycosyltransferase involved in cell wall biosynthesis
VKDAQVICEKTFGHLHRQWEYLKMKIGIYSHISSYIGGAQNQVVALAQDLSQFGQVDILQHGNFDRDKVAVYCGSALGSSIHLCELPSQRLDYVADYQRALDWGARLTEPYDLFISFTHFVPPFNAAPRGIFSVLFPIMSIPDSFSQTWQRHIVGYQHRVANSHFTKQWAKRRWNIDCQVIYPGVKTNFQVVNKLKSILSVGRFATSGISKKQLDMIVAFQWLKESRLRDWDYFCVGGMDRRPEEHTYFELARRLATKSQAQVMANVNQGALIKMYEQAAVFWHAAGLGIDENLTPELTEHFGIVTVEAMAAGCVPIVINRGGQPEIVQHGVNGFLWNTIDELKKYTELVAHDERLLRQLSEAAHARARSFSQEKMLTCYRNLLYPLPNVAFQD